MGGSSPTLSSKRCRASQSICRLGVRGRLPTATLTPARRPLTVYGKGQQTRSFQYVSDLVAGLVALMNGNYSDPVNLGNPDEYTMEEFARKIITITGSSSKLEYLPLPKDDPSRRRPDISLARRVIGWEPKVTVDQGLRKARLRIGHPLGRPRPAHITLILQAIEYFSGELQKLESSDGSQAHAHRAGPVRSAQYGPRPGPRVCSAKPAVRRFGGEALLGQQRRGDGRVVNRD